MCLVRAQCLMMYASGRIRGSISLYVRKSSVLETARELLKERSQWAPEIRSTNCTMGILAVGLSFKSNIPKDCSAAPSLLSQDIISYHLT